MTPLADFECAGRDFRYRCFAQVAAPSKIGRERPKAEIGADTFSDLVKGIAMFIVDVHPFQINQRKLARPYDLFSEGLERRPPAAYPVDSDKLRLISGMSKPLTVDQGGVGLLGLPYGGTALKDVFKRMGGKFKTECRWDPDDLANLCVAERLSRGGS